MEKIKEYFDDVGIVEHSNMKYLVLKNNVSKSDLPIDLQCVSTSTNSNGRTTLEVSLTNGQVHTYRGEFPTEKVANEFSQRIMKLDKECQDHNGRMF